MQTFNQTLFFDVNAHAKANTNAAALVLAVTRVLADDLIWRVPIALLISGLRGDDAIRGTLLPATSAGVLALTFAQHIGQVWPHPRPFMIGLGHGDLAHLPDASFPRDHLTLWWTVSFSLRTCRQVRTAGVAMSLPGVPIAGARACLGVHLPLDMAGAAGLALLSATVSMHGRRHHMTPRFSLARSPHRAHFAPSTPRGWQR